MGISLRGISPMCGCSSIHLQKIFFLRSIVEDLELPIDLVQIKGLWIKLAPDPFHHLLMLGVLRIVDRVQKARVPPDATAILWRTGAFAREAHRIALPRF